MKLNKGFTLIELLVVVAIISLLTSIVLAALVEAREKAQKSKLKQEINELVKAIELYKADKGYYPLEDQYPNANIRLNMSGDEVASPNNSKFSNYLVPKYLPKIPSVINPILNSSSRFLYYVHNSGTAGDTNQLVKCLDDINIPPYVILAYKSNTGINFDSIDWEYGYKFDQGAGWQEPGVLENFKCFSIE